MLSQRITDMNRYSYILPIFQMTGFHAIKLNFILKGIKYQKIKRIFAPVNRMLNNGCLAD